MFDFDWTTVATFAAIGFSIFMMGRFSTRRPKRAGMMTIEKVQYLTEAQMRAHNAIQALEKLERKHGSMASVVAHTLFTANEYRFLDEFGITHDDFLNGIRYVTNKIWTYGQRELATF